MNLISTIKVYLKNNDFSLNDLTESISLLTILRNNKFEEYFDKNISSELELIDGIKLLLDPNEIKNTMSLSKIYQEVTNAKIRINEKEYSLAKKILGNSGIPTFNEFKEKIPYKELSKFSLLEGYKILIKFNKEIEIEKKLNKQNKNTFNK